MKLILFCQTLLTSTCNIGILTLQNSQKTNDEYIHICSEEIILGVPIAFSYFSIQQNPVWEVAASYKKGTYLSRAAEDLITISTDYWSSRMSAI
jgi:hypothetical protein